MRRGRMQTIMMMVDHAPIGNPARLPRRAVQGAGEEGSK